MWESRKEGWLGKLTQAESEFQCGPFSSCVAQTNSLTILRFVFFFSKIMMYVCMLSHTQLFVTQWAVARQAHEIFLARILEWFAFPSPGDLSNPGIEPTTPESPVMYVDSLLLSH